MDKSWLEELLRREKAFKGGQGSGDLEGHEFRGNQYTGDSSQSHAEWAKEQNAWPAELTEKELGDINRFGKDNRKDANLTTAQRSAVIEYRRAKAFDINESLRNKARLSNEDTALVKNIDAAIVRSVLDKDIMVYRGAAFGEKAKVGEVISSPAYLSTTFSGSEANNFSMGPGSYSTVYKLYAPRGSHGLYTEGLAPRGYQLGSGQETEILFPRNTRIKITDISRIGSTTFISGRIIK